MGNIQNNAILSLVQEGIIFFDNMGIITFANKAALMMLGCYKKDVIGIEIDTLLRVYNDSSLVLPMNDIFHTVFEKNSNFTGEKDKQSFVISKIGERIPVDIFAQKLPKENIKDKESGIVILCDRTKLASLVQYKKDTIRRLGMLTPILSKMSVGDYSASVDIPQVKNEFTELFVALKIIFSDMEKSNTPLLSNDGVKPQDFEKEGWQLVEMAGHKTAELKEAKSHMESIIENLSSGLIEYDGTFRIKRMNSSAEQMIGVLAIDIIGKNIMPEDVHRHKNWESLVLVSYPILDPKARKLKKKLFGKDTSAHLITVHYPLEREIEVVTIPLSDSETGVREGFIKVLRDVTRERMIAKSKSEFISVAAHQLRTPLSGIKWVMSLIIDEDVGKINATQRKLLNKGYEANQKMIRLVNDLLNVARIEDGRFGYQFDKNNFVSFVQDIINGLQVIADEKNISLIFKADSTIGEFIFDEAKMSIVIQNLVDNAIKYTPEKGEVTVELTNIGDYVKFEVQDSGIGIPEDQLGRMFSKFFRASNAVKTQVTGSGLGLFIVKNIVARHGGRITVESIENKGSKFMFIIPTKESLIPRQDPIVLS